MAKHAGPVFRNKPVTVELASVAEVGLSGQVKTIPVFDVVVRGFMWVGRHVC